MKFPLAQCAFKGCGWVFGITSSNAWAKRNDESLERKINSHLAEAHRDALERKINFHLAEAHRDAFKDPGFVGGDPMPYYCAAIRVREEAHEPAVGPSIDRRTIASLLRECNTDKVQQLICFVCAQSNARTEHPNADIDFQKGMGTHQSTRKKSTRD